MTEHVSTVLDRALAGLTLTEAETSSLHAMAELENSAAAADYLNQPYRFATESPIEKALAHALWDAAFDLRVPEVYEPQRDLFLGVGRGCWFRLETQVPVGPYRADLLLTHVAADTSNHPDGVRLVIECDGHDFHDRTKEQAEHDRRRDRFLQACGYRVLRFTGSEIHRDAGAAADECLRH